MYSVNPHIIPDIEKWPIHQISKNRAEFVQELNAFALERILENQGDRIPEILEKTFYLEKIRCKKNPWKVDPSDELSYWSGLEKTFQQASESEDMEAIHLSLLKRVINRYSEEITGSFNPKTFRFIRKFLTSFYRRIFNKAINKKHFGVWGSRDQLYKRLRVEGPLEEVRELFKKGTVVVVPTHFSNLDSICIGYALDHIAGLPAFAYGAGLNLYDYELVAYFIGRLGAYKVDRRKKNPIYLECLKSMACYSLQKGVNNIFFPGGSRSRSGAIEERLKLGLLGSVVESQRLHFQEMKNDRIYIVPIVVGYHFVLEGKSLIEQHLRSTGKEKYRKSKIQSRSFTKISKFIWSLFSESSEVVFSLGEPMDVLGNPVNKDGVSVDEKGNPIDIKEYFKWNGKVTQDSQRETVYTKILGDKILSSYYRNNIVLTSHLLAYVGYRLLKASVNEDSIFELSNYKPGQLQVDKEKLTQAMTDILKLLGEWEEKGKIKLDRDLHLPVQEVIKKGFHYLGDYHVSDPLYMKNGTLRTEDIRLLYFYHNRLENYGIDKVIEWNKYFSAATSKVEV